MNRYENQTRVKHKNKWQAQIRINGNHKYLGLYATPEPPSRFGIALVMIVMLAAWVGVYLM